MVFIVIGTLFWTIALPATVARSNLQDDTQTTLFESTDEDEYRFADYTALYRDNVFFVMRDGNQTDRDLYRMRKDGSQLPVLLPIDFDPRCLHVYKEKGKLPFP